MQNNVYQKPYYNFQTPNILPPQQVTHDTDTLSEFLHINAQMIDELYHSVYKPEDKNLFISYFNNMQTVSSG